MPGFSLTVRTPDRVLFDGPADLVRLSTEEGEVEVHPNHADLQGVVGFSRVVVKHDGHEEDFVVRHGMLFVDGEANSVRVSAFDGELVAEMDVGSARSVLETIRARLAEGKDLSDLAIRFLEDQRLSMEKHIEHASAHPGHAEERP